MSNKKNYREPASDEVNSFSDNRNCERKYGRRQIWSNWDRYESENLEDDSITEKKGTDFADLVNTPSDCNYFQFKSEKNWESEATYSTFSGHKFFNLDLEVLSNGLACLPFYERVEINKSLLSQLDIEKCDRKANLSLLKYKAIKEHFMEKLQKDYELPGSVEEMGAITTEYKKNRPQVFPVNINDASVEAEILFDFSPNAKLDNDETECGENVKQSKTDEESLEEWLDSVLGD